MGQDGDQHAEREADAVADRRRCCEGCRQPEEKVQTGDWTGMTIIYFSLDMLCKGLNFAGVFLVREQGSCTRCKRLYTQLPKWI